MYLGIDIGTSGVKAVLVDGDGAVAGSGDGTAGSFATARSVVGAETPTTGGRRRLQPWVGCARVVPAEIGAVRGIGLSGQMHGATLLGDDHRPLRPGILWNDMRSGDQCQELEAIEPRTWAITGNQAMPGFTAPKLMWVAQHEPDIFAKVRMVLLPKDYVRLRLTGEAISDLSDSAGTLWLDVAGRKWSPEMLAATRLTEAQMPRLVEGSEVGGTLTEEAAEALGVPAGVPVAGGGGDNAAGAVGVGVVVPGRAFLSLGTSGVLFAATEAFAPNPGQGVHAFCHALPGVWHQMSVIISAATCVDWVAALTGAGDVASLSGGGGSGQITPATTASVPVFLPYLMGERTPHNDPKAKGVFFGMTPDTDRAALGRAVLEGVSFAFADGLQALQAAGTRLGSISVIGGGARSRFWGRILASTLNAPLDYHAGGEVGPAYGAARLAIMAVTGAAPADVALRPDVDATVDPDPALVDGLAAKLAKYRALYKALQPHFG